MLDYRPLLVLCAPGDSIVERFTQQAGELGLEIWRPSCLQEITWSYLQEGGHARTSVRDVRSGRTWDSAELAGVWYQSLPPADLPETLDDVDRRYVSGEATSSLVATLAACRCPVFGAPAPDRRFEDVGVESRIELRRHGLPVAVDHVAPFGELVDRIRDVEPADIWVTRKGRSSWSAELLNGVGGSVTSDEIVIGTPTHGRRVAAVLHVHEHMRIVRCDREHEQSSPSVERPASTLLETTASLIRTIAVTIGMTYFVQQGGRWVITRTSTHIPAWLDDAAVEWLSRRLFGAILERRDRSSLTKSRM